MNQLISRWVNWRQGSREEPGDESADQQVGKLDARAVLFLINERF
jgi:hypothetical protein